MEIIKCTNYDDVSKKAANIVIKEIITKPTINLGLATGSSPIGLYKNLIEANHNEIISFKNVKTFNLDEYIGIAQSHPQSYYSFMFNNLFQYVDINIDNVHIPGNDINNLDQLADDYNDLLSDNVVDLQILGIGSNGHIGFNEPGTTYNNGTFIVDLDDQTRQDNARFFTSIDDVPTKAITMGIKNIMKSKRIVLIASGESKSEAIYKAVNGEIDSQLPASILQLHPNVTIIVDEAAGKLL